MLKVEHLSKTYATGLMKKKTFRAVEDISFEVPEGETLGIVGESGSGKSTVAQCVVRLVAPTGGSIFFKDKDITKMKARELAAFRPNMQMVFQDPDSALNPRMTLGQSLREAWRLQKRRMTQDEAEKKAEELSNTVGLAKEHLDRYPHELSGGQNQRAVIARALSFEPSILVADEPTASLDVSVQAQILFLLKEIQKKYGITMLLISHDMDIIRHMCERVLVLYQGRAVESGTAEEVLLHPQHPYTRMLLHQDDEKFRTFPEPGMDSQTQELVADYAG